MIGSEKGLNMSEYWCDNSAVRTHFLNAWSVLFPPWEKVFATVALHHKQYITDESLKARIDEFAAQETAHANAHQAHNARVGTTDLERKQERRAKVALLRPQNPMWLATMVSIEHLAACCSRLYLDLYGNQATREHKLFKWHSLEELDHKSLAMDIWLARGFDQQMLKKACLANQKFIWKFVLGYVFEHLKKDGSFKKPSTYLELLVVSAIVFKGIYVPSMKVFAKDFHPNNVSDTKYMRFAV
jgi:predicted metal-dependent hydrolase